MPIHGKDELMFLVNPFRLTLQIIITLICQPKPCITDSRCLWPNINSYGWYPVVLCAIALYTDIKDGKCSTYCLPAPLLRCFEGSTLDKSIHSRSIRLCAIIVPIFFHGSTKSPFTVWRHGQFFT